MKYRISLANDDDFQKTVIGNMDTVRNFVSKYFGEIAGKHVSVLPWRLVHLQVLNALCREEVSFIRECDDFDYCLYWFVDGEYKHMVLSVCTEEAAINAGR